MDADEKNAGRRKSVWSCLAILFGVINLGLIVALVVVVVLKQQPKSDNSEEQSSESSFPCPPQSGGLVTSGDPEKPSPFYGLTRAEYGRLYAFLRKQQDLNLAPPGKAGLNTSNIFIVDLLMPRKQDLLSFLDNQGTQPAREALVIVFRGDRTPQLVEEYRVGPLDKPTYAELMVNSQRRNPVPFSLRPLGGVEVSAVLSVVTPKIDQKVGDILAESYGCCFAVCSATCLRLLPAPLGSGLTGNLRQRHVWWWASYQAEYYTLYPLDFGVLVNATDTDPDQWTVEKVWYSGAIYDSLDDLADKYANDPNTHKTQVRFAKKAETTQTVRGDRVPKTPQRAPVQMEPDGKRYTVNYCRVRYLHWDFHLRLSALTGPQVCDVRFRGERVAYELGLSEIAVFHSARSPIHRVADNVDSGALIGTHSRSLIPGADCPEGATFLNVSFLGEAMGEATTLERAMCVFEQNTGVPLRRHLSYSRDQGAFYGGMSDSVLIFRSILTIVNYDYIMDFVFHQNGAIEVRVMLTGYLLGTFYRKEEEPYGFRLDQKTQANLHHHMFHFKADLDIGGMSNRYETLDISQDVVQLEQVSPTATYKQIKFQRHLYNTEKEAMYKFNFDTPKYHIVHNDLKKTDFETPRAYRLHMAGMSKQLLTEGMDNEVSIPWARQQLAVTVQKDEELVSSSPYAMFDSKDPVTNFSNFISDESIVDKDLVLWITMGLHHIPHTEDLPVTATVGGHLSFFLLPYNYFPECPSVSSRDNIRVDYVTPNQPADGLKVERNGNKANRACGAVTLEQIVKERPDDILQTHRDFKLL